MKTGSQRTLFYVVKEPRGYVVWEMAREKIFERTRTDPTLNSRLDRVPFATRAEAEQRCRELNRKG